MRTLRLDELPEAELQAMRRDGEVVAFGHPGYGGYRSVFEPPTPTMRASTLRLVAGPRFAVAGESACWVHAGGPAPDRPSVGVPRGRRPAPPLPGVDYRTVALPASAVVEFGGVLVTTPERTLTDLLRAPVCRLGAVIALARGTGLGRPEIEAAVAALGRQPFSRLARTRLPELFALLGTGAPLGRAAA